MTPAMKECDLDKATPKPPRRGVSFLILMVVVAVSLTAAVFHRQNPLVQRAGAYAQQVATASAATYITLRSLNAVLSTAQSVEVGGALFVSGTAHPMKVLEPIDDTIERIASVVFALMIATGILSLSVGPLGAVGGGMIAIAGTIWMADLVLGKRDVTSALSRRLIWYGVFFLVALPLAFVLADLLSGFLTGQILAEHEAIVNDITASVGSATPGEDIGILQQADQYRELAGNIWGRADELIGSYIAILSVFIFRIFLLPALIVGGFLVLTRFFAHRD